MTPSRCFAFSIATLIAMSTTPACVSTPEPEASDESFEGDALVVAESVSDGDTLAQRLSELFLVEHTTVALSPGMAKMMATSPPGGLVFWNLGRGTVSDLRETIRAYEAARVRAGRPRILYSTDYEGGGQSYTTRGSFNAGVQRFITGMTSLAHPRWIGLAYRRNHAVGEELATLHGKLMAQELASVGINYPLATVSDLAEGLFVNRSVDVDPAVVAPLVARMYDGYASVPGGIFVTKHFPGLGQTTGDTHEGLVVSKVTDPAIAGRHLRPFSELIDHSSASPFRLSVLCGHAKYPLYDSIQQTTVSEPILKGLLRGPKVQFQGLSLSDAMWMGPYGTMPTSALFRVYVHATLSGMDMLMIPGFRYGAALSYFRKVYNGTLSLDEQALLSAKVGLRWPELRATFKARAAESQARFDAAREVIGDVRSALESPGSTPKDRTQLNRARYQELLRQTDPAWASKSL